jgi:hypothetical protein
MALPYPTTSGIADVGGFWKHVETGHLQIDRVQALPVLVEQPRHAPRPDSVLCLHLTSAAKDQEEKNICRFRATFNSADKCASGCALCGIYHHGHDPTRSSGGNYGKGLYFTPPPANATYAASYFERRGQKGEFIFNVVFLTRVAFPEGKTLWLREGGFSPYTERINFLACTKERADWKWDLLMSKYETNTEEVLSCNPPEEIHGRPKCAAPILAFHQGRINDAELYDLLLDAHQRSHESIVNPTPRKLDGSQGVFPRLPNGAVAHVIATPHEVVVYDRTLCRPEICIAYKWIP